MSKAIPYFGRYCKVVFSSYERDKGITIYGAPNEYNARVTFTVTKTKLIGKFPTATIKIYGLSLADGGILQKINSKTCVKLYAGYLYDFKQNNNLKPIFTGKIISKKTINNKGYETVTTFECYNGATLLTTTMDNFSISKNTNFIQVLSTLKRNIETSTKSGYTMEPPTQLISNGIFDNFILTNGFKSLQTQPISSFLDNFCANLSTEKKKISWFLDDVNNQIKFYDVYKENQQYSNTTKIIYQKNLLSYDDSALAREAYDRIFINSPKKQSFNQGFGDAKVKSYFDEDVSLADPLMFKSDVGKNVNTTYNASSNVNNVSSTGELNDYTALQKTKKEFMYSIILEQNISLKNKFEFINVPNVPKELQISKIVWSGDTHDTGNRWRADLYFQKYNV